MTMDDTAILEIENLVVEFGKAPQIFRAIDQLSFSIRRGGCYGLVGESGSGKSTVALAILDYLGASGRITSGHIRFEGRDTAWLSPADRHQLRRNGIAIVYQDPISSLNPAMTIGSQLSEVPSLASIAPGRRDKAVEEILESVRLPDPARLRHRYPHQLSGGQQQRVVIAMALLAQPRLLILDEPTTGLDATVESEILDLIAELRQKYVMSLLFISHNLGVIAHVCDTVGVMRGGVLVENGPAARVLQTPEHSYTQSLLACLPRPDDTKLTRSLLPFGPSSVAAPAEDRPAARNDDEPVLRISNLSKIYRGRGSSLLGRERPAVYGNRNLNMLVRRGEILGIVGESGSGKSTFAKILAGLETASEGSVEFRRTDISRLRAAERPKEIIRSLQIVFQNPDRTLNPSHTVGYILDRVLRSMGAVSSRAERSARVHRLLDLVKLPAAAIDRYPDELSGGQKQRVAIARAFAAEPEVVICDEPVSALDVMVQAAIVELLVDVQRRLGTTLIFISHDLALVNYLADRVAVMYRGEIVDFGDARTVLTAPTSSYTQRLIDSAASSRLQVQAASVA